MDIFKLIAVLILYYMSTVSSISYQLDEDSEEKIVFLFAESFHLNEEVFDELKKYDLIKLYEITPTTYIFLHSGSGVPDESISKAKKTFKENIVEIEKVKRYVQFYHIDEPKFKAPQIQRSGQPNLVCDKYWGMGIEDAWSRGYSGNDIVVAVTDVGVNTDLIDLHQNIIFEVIQTKDYYFELKTSSDVMARYPKVKSVDIFSNSWGPDHPFMTINLDQKEALKLSSKEGRKGLGALQIFPVCAVGNELANNEHTITVSAVGPHGKTPSDSIISASVLTAGLRNGNNLTAESMVTTSRGNKCITSFEGVSAATAQVAGILALALEANPSLTFDDVQDLIVHSSDVGCLADTENITTNAAGLTFHPVFGFGILNASKIVTNAKEALEGLRFLPQTVSEISSCSSDEGREYTAEFCYSCRGNDDCFGKVKTVRLQIKYTTTAHRMRISLVSPNGTKSVLQDFRSKHIKTQTRREQVLTSVHFWDEPAFGLWTLKFHSDGTLNMRGQVSLTLIGTVSNIKANTYTPGANGTECAPTCRSHVDTTTRSRYNIFVVVFVPIAVVVLVVCIILFVCHYRNLISCKYCPYSQVNTRQDENAKL